MSKFWQKKYTSKYTGAEIDAAVAKAGDATKVEANPTLAGTEAALEGLQVGDTKYKVTEIPTIEITQTEIGDILLQLASDLNDATGDFQYKIYEISDASIAASLGAKISAAYAKGSCANLSVYGVGTMNCYVTSATGFFIPVSSIYMKAIQKRFALCMQLNISGNNTYIRFMFALATEFAPK